MKRKSWELPEIVVVSILTAVSALALGGLVSGILGSVGSTPFVPEGTAQILVQATAWAGFFTAFMVLVALLVIWWHVETWSEVIDPDEDLIGLEEDQPEDAADEVEQDEEISIVLTSAFRHVTRGRALAVWAGISALVVFAGAAVYFVSYVVYFASPGGSPFVWELRTLQVGSMVATLVLCGAGVLGTIWVLRLCSSYLTVPMEEEIED